MASTKIISNRWTKGKNGVKCYYPSEKEYVCSRGLLSSAKYNLKTNVFSLQYINDFPTLIDEQETRKVMLKKLKQYLHPTSGSICVVEQMHKTRNEESYKYCVQYYTTLSGIPTEFEMKEIQYILNHPVESDDEEYALWLKCNREITKKCTGLDYDENHITKAGISEIYHKKYAPSITLEEYITSEAQKEHKTVSY